MVDETTITCPEVHSRTVLRVEEGTTICVVVKETITSTVAGVTIILRVRVALTP
jgi:hypothetical protein